MQIINKTSSNNQYDPVHHFDFSFADRDDIVLWIGASCGDSNQERVKDKLNICIDLEQPNSWYPDSAISRALNREKMFDKIIAISEATTNTRNTQLGVQRYIYTFFPFSAKYIPTDFTKEYDIFYSGHVNPDYPLHKHIMIPVLQKFEKTHKVFVVSGRNRKHTIYANIGEIDYPTKLNLNAKSKISITYDHHYPGASRWSNKVPSINGKFGEWRKGKMGEWCSPQHKARTVEAFFTKSLALVYRDPFNIIENFCTPDKHFIYYDSKEDLQEKCEHILQNYEDPYYQNIINNAYEHAIENFTTEAFYNRYIKGL